jgi:hypothetical protein
MLQPTMQAMSLKGYSQLFITHIPGPLKVRSVLAATQVGIGGVVQPLGQGMPPPEPPALEPPVLEPPTLEPPVLEPPALEPPALEPPVLEPPTLEPPALEPPALEPPMDELALLPTAAWPPLAVSDGPSLLEPQPTTTRMLASAKQQRRSMPVMIRDSRPRTSWHVVASPATSGWAVQLGSPRRVTRIMSGRAKRRVEMGRVRWG